MHPLGAGQLMSELADGPEMRVTGVRSFVAASASIAIASGTDATT